MKVERQEIQMRKIFLLLILMICGLNSYAATRTITTYKPIPYSRPANYYSHYNHYNNYRNPYYYRNYNHNYYGNRYYNSGYNYYPSSSFWGVRNYNRPYYNNNYYRPNYSSRFFIKGDMDSGIVNISNHTPYTDSQISAVEKNFYGKSFEYQDLDLRLNRLEKMIFNEIYPSKATEDRIENIMVNYKEKFNPISDKKLQRLEKKVFRRTYDNNSDQERVSRLEEQVLGAIQQGDLSSRVDNLDRIIANRQFTPPVSSPYGTCYGGYIPQMSSYGGWRGALNSLGSFFGGGYPTGLTPQMPPYNSLDFGMNDGGNSQMYVDNYGYMYNNSRTGTGSSIQILD